MKQSLGSFLPEWAFLDAQSHLGNPLADRTLILHLKSASVIEIFDRDTTDFLSMKKDVPIFNFKYTSVAGVEKLAAILHYCCTIADRNTIINDVLKPCAIWYCNYCAWEDDNIINRDFNEDQ